MVWTDEATVGMCHVYYKLLLAQCVLLVDCLLSQVFVSADI